jgi:hypothetical protein
LEDRFMKRAFFFVVPFALAFVLSTVRADETVELTGTVGCAHCNFEKDTGASHCAAAAKVGDKVYTLTGDKVDKNFKKGGDWVIKGKISQDGKSIEVSEMQKKA